MLRRIGYVVAALLALVILAIGGALVWLHTASAHTFAQRMIASHGSALVNGTISVGRVEGALLGDVHLIDVRITQPAGPVAVIDRIDVSYRPWRVLATNVTVDDVTLTRPRIEATQRADGWNVASLFARKQPSTAPSRTISLPHLHIVDGAVHLAPASGAARDVSAIDADASMAIGNNATEFTLARASARDATSSVTLKSLTLDGRIDANRTTLQHLDVVTDASHVSGRLDLNGAGPSQAITAHLDAAPIALPEVALYVPQVKDMTVAPTGSVDVSGPPNALKFAWRMTSDAGGGTGTLLMTSSSSPETHLSGEADVHDVNLARFVANPSLDGRVSGRGTIDVTLPSGKADETTIAFSTVSASVAIGTYRAASVKAKGTYARGVVHVVATGAAYGAAVDVTAEFVPATERLSARGHLAHADLRRLPKTWSVPALATDANGTYDVAGGPSGWRATLQFEPSTIEGAALAAGATASVDTRVRGYTYGFHGDVAHLDLPRITKVIGTTLPASADLDGSRFNGRIDAEGRGTTLATLGVDVRVDLHDSQWAGLDFQTITGDACIDDRRLVANVKAALASAAPQSVSVSRMSAMAAGGGADLHVEIPDLAAPIALDTMSARATVDLNGAEFRQIPVRTLHVQGALDRGIATVDAFSIASDAFDANASGTIALGDQGSSNLAYEVFVRDASALASVSPEPLSGALHTKGTITGAAGTPAAAGELHASEFHAGPASALSLDGTYTTQVPIHDLSHIAAHFDGSAAFIEVGSTKIEHATATVGYENEQLDVQTTIEQQNRSLTLAGSVIPHPQDREIRVRQLAIAANGQQWQLAAGHEAVAHYADRAISVTGFDLTNGPAHLTIDGTVGAPAGGNVTASALTISAQQVSLDSINAMMLGSHKYTGVINGTATISGSLADPSAAFTADVGAGSVDNAAFQSITAKGNYSHGVLALDGALEAAGAGRLAVNGTMPLAMSSSTTAEAPYDMHVSSDAINLAFLQPMTSEVEKLAGTAKVDVHVTGPRTKPAFEGNVNLSGATAFVAATGVTYTNIGADLVLAGQQVTVNSFHVEDDDGHVGTITGSLNVVPATGPSAFNLQMSAHDMHVLKNQFGELTLDFDLHAAGDLHAPLVSGTIKVTRGLIEADTLLERLNAGGYQSEAPASTTAAPTAAPSPATAGTPPITETKTAPATAGPLVPVATPAESSSAMSGGSMSVTLDLPDNVTVRGRNLKGSAGAMGMGDVNVTIGGALSIAKDTGGPTSLLGRLNIVRGTYSFQGRAFDLQQGSELQFRCEPSDPALNVTASREVSGVMAQVHLTGTATRPQLALSSDPPLDQGDILSLIVFNQSMNELPTSARVSLAARAGAMAAGAVATPISDSVAHALDLDLFEISPAAEGTATITVGRQVSDKLFVSFKQLLGTSDASQLSFEYRLSQFLRVVTSLAQGAQSERQVPHIDTAGLDLIFVIRR